MNRPFLGTVTVQRAPAALVAVTTPRSGSVTAASSCSIPSTDGTTWVALTATCDTRHSDGVGVVVVGRGGKDRCDPPLHAVIATVSMATARVRIGRLTPLSRPWFRVRTMDA